MKKKILCILLCVSIILPCFVVFSFAESSDKYIEQGKAEGADEFVDVANYVENAGKPGCTDLLVLGIDAAKVGEVIYEGEAFRYIDYDFVIYNPMLYALNFDSDVCGSAKITLDKSQTVTDNITDCDFDVRLSADSTYNLLIPDSMFIRLTVRTIDINDALGTKFVFNKFIINANDVSFELDANCSTEFNDINLVIPYTDVVSDLAYFTEQTKWGIRDYYNNFTEEEPLVLFAYEVGYGTSEHALYVYIYNPTCLDVELDMLTVEDGLQPENLDLISLSSEHLEKYKLKNLDYHCLVSGNIRNYYIAGINCYSSSDSKYYDNKSHFAFSDNEIPEGYSEKFSYTYTPEADSGNNEIYYIDSDELSAGDEFKIYFSYDEFNSADIILEKEYQDKFDVVFKDGYISLTVVENLSEWGANVFEFSDIIAYSSLPYYVNWEDVGRLVPEEFKFTWSFRKAGTEEEIFDELYEGVCKINCDYFTYIPTTTYSARASSSDELYLTVNSDQVVELELFDTYYRLDSSATGINLYQTLQSVYFTMPNSYLEKGDGNLLNDRTVSAIEFEYYSAMMTPGIYTSESSVLDYLEKFVGEDVTNSDEYTFILYTKDYDHSVDIDGNITYNCDYLLGKDYFTTGSIINPIAVFIEPDKHLNSFNYLFYGENYDFFQEVISSEEMLSAIKEKQSYDGKLEYTHFVLHDYNTFDLKNILDMPYEKMVEKFGPIRAFFLYNFGTKQAYMDSINDIEAIRTVSGVNLLSAINLDNDKFSKTYYVALSDVSAVKGQMQEAYNNNEAFVFFRYDVYDYYAADVYDEKGKIDNTFLFQGKYYENFDIINIELSNVFDKKVFAEKAASIDIAPVITTPEEEMDILDPSDKEFGNPDNWNGQNSQNIKDFLQDIQDFFNNITAVIGILLMMPVIIFGVWGVTTVIGLFTNNKKKE